jgi:SAM-dependent methyltransferase
MKILDWLHGSFVHVGRVRALCTLLADLIPPGALVLDVGCGDGLLAKSLCEKRPDIRIDGIDVMARGQTHIPVRVFDGLRIPYEDNGVDVALLVDVLHHSENPMTLLREAKRVARQAIVIKDHMAEGTLAELRLRFMDWVGNVRYGVSLPYDYWSRQRWEEAFRKLGLSVEYWTSRIHLYPPPAQWVFGGSLHFAARLHPGRDNGAP